MILRLLIFMMKNEETVRKNKFRHSWGFFTLSVSNTQVTEIVPLLMKLSV